MKNIVCEEGSKKEIDIRNWKEKIHRSESRRTFGTGFILKGQKISKANFFQSDKLLS